MGDMQDKRRAGWFARWLAFPILLLMQGCDGASMPVDLGGTVGGIESIEVDGRRYYFAYDYRSDRVLSSLFADPDAAADFAAREMRQRDGRKPKAFWRALAVASVNDPQVASERQEAQVSLQPLKQSIAALRTSPSAQTPHLEVPTYLHLLLVSNEEWPGQVPIPSVELAATRLGLEADDTSPWLEESASMLRGATPLPEGASHADARAVFLWTWDDLIGAQRFGWAETLQLR